jgi:pyruvate formate lyase activating enzyme
VTLLIPGFNDSRDELTRLTAFLASISPDIPWHVTAFHGDYKMQEPDNTDSRDAATAADTAVRTACAMSTRAIFLARSAIVEHTLYHCGDLLIARRSASSASARDRRRRLSRLRTTVPGRWDSRFTGQLASRRLLGADAAKCKVQ